MKGYIKLLTALVAGFFFSCEKDVLNKNPLDVIDQELVWEDANLAQLYLNDVYLNIPGGLGRGLDCATEIGEGGHNWHPAQPFNTGEVTPGNAPFADAWDLYYPIRSLNQFIAQYNTGQGDAETNDGLLGQAYFLRALFYSELVNFFGGVPIISSAQSLDEDLFVPRNSYEECVDFIVADLDAAAGLLPSEWSPTEVGKATSGAALALKSRALLYAASPLHNEGNDLAKWQLAADAAWAVISSEQYALYPDYNGLFLNDNNEEVIFDIQFAYPYRTNDWDYMTNPQGFNGAYGMTRPTQELVNSYEMANGRAIGDPESGYDLAAPYVGRDPRFYASILYNGASWRGRTLETFVDGANGPGAYDEYATSLTMTGYYLKKFLNEENPLSYGDNRWSANWIVIRYAEVLLNYAEAQLNLGHEDEARAYINRVRERSDMPEIPNDESGQALRARYMNERKVELAFEEQYFFDVRRWKTAPQLLNVPVHKMTIERQGGGGFQYTEEVMEPRSWRDAFYFLPIPQEEIDKNPNLTQNDDY
ncbi:RagB/SusD family nutrient uptake outer membrane protein [Parapedobacter koreensis]|uniref:Starch-binding associating with outer membrane n=1 Tax=Parapedobacter koreensis TaxID=332977 RepID=A0A1H7TI87_9SPHI|nr:RagB/SusD family nutrient uptake outer membrane protein [Parapedobacter koreensis]SEL84433.1 Starch-binding associating with outer membrane [Parapedobacter koreensis]